MIKFLQITERLQVLVTVDGIYRTKMDTFRASSALEGAGKQTGRDRERIRAGIGIFESNV